MKIGKYITAEGLFSLPVPISCVALGVMLAAADYHVDWKVVLAVFMTAVFLHFLSVCVGTFSRRCLMVLSALSAAAAVYFTYGSLFLLESFIMLIAFWMLLNIVSRMALNSREAGTAGQCMRDFIIYAAAGVCGSYFVCAHTLSSWLIILPAVSAGVLGAAVRYHAHLDSPSSKWVQTALVSSSWIFMLMYSSLRVFDLWHYLFVLTLPLSVLYLYRIWKTDAAAGRSSYVILLVSSAVFPLFAGLGFLVFLI